MVNAHKDSQRKGDSSEEPGPVACGERLFEIIEKSRSADPVKDYLSLLSEEKIQQVLRQTSPEVGSEGKTPLHKAADKPDLFEYLLGLYEDDASRLQAIKKLDEDGRSVLYAVGVLENPSTEEKLITGKTITSEHCIIELIHRHLVNTRKIQIDEGFEATQKPVTIREPAPYATESTQTLFSDIYINPRNLLIYTNKIKDFSDSKLSPKEKAKQLYVAFDEAYSPLLLSKEKRAKKSNTELKKIYFKKVSAALRQLMEDLPKSIESSKFISDEDKQEKNELSLQWKKTLTEFEHLRYSKWTRTWRYHPKISVILDNQSNKFELNWAYYEFFDKFKQRIGLVKVTERLFGVQALYFAELLFKLFRSNGTPGPLVFMEDTIFHHLNFLLQFVDSLFFSMGAMITPRDKGFRKWSKVFFATGFLVLAGIPWLCAMLAIKIASIFFKIAAIILGVIKTTLDIRHYDLKQDKNKKQIADLKAQFTVIRSLRRTLVIKRKKISGRRLIVEDPRRSGYENPPEFLPGDVSTEIPFFLPILAKHLKEKDKKLIPDHIYDILDDENLENRKKLAVAINALGKEKWYEIADRTVEDIDQKISDLALEEFKLEKRLQQQKTLCHSSRVRIRDKNVALGISTISLIGLTLAALSPVLGLPGIALAITLCLLFTTSAIAKFSYRLYTFSRKETAYEIRTVLSEEMNHQRVLKFSKIHPELFSLQESFIIQAKHFNYTLEREKLEKQLHSLEHHSNPVSQLIHFFKQRSIRKKIDIIDKKISNIHQVTHLKSVFDSREELKKHVTNEIETSSRPSKKQLEMLKELESLDKAKSYQEVVDIIKKIDLLQLNHDDDNNKNGDSERYLNAIENTLKQESKLFEDPQWNEDKDLQFELVQAFTKIGQFFPHGDSTQLTFALIQLYESDIKFYRDKGEQKQKDKYEAKKNELIEKFKHEKMADAMKKIKRFCTWIEDKSLFGKEAKLRLLMEIRASASSELENHKAYQPIMENYRSMLNQLKKDKPTETPIKLDLTQTRTPENIPSIADNPHATFTPQLSDSNISAENSSETEATPPSVLVLGCSA